jgi:hypothetical protein
MVGKIAGLWSRRWVMDVPRKCSQSKLKQKEIILELGNPLKSKSKFTKSKIGLGASTSTPHQGFTLNPLGAF